MVMKSYKFRLYPTKKQIEVLEWTLDRCRELYNAALQERRDAWNNIKRHPNFYDEEWRKQAAKEHRISFFDQVNQLPDVRKIREEYKGIYAQVLRDPLQRVQKAFDGFFRRVASGQTAGYPRFQGKGRYDSFTYSQLGFSLTHDNRVCLSKIGSIKIKLHREIVGKIKTCTIKVRRVSSSKRARQNVVGIIGISHVHLAYPCLTAEISKEKGECSMLGGRQRRRELSAL